MKRFAPALAAAFFATGASLQAQTGSDQSGAPMAGRPAQDTQHIATTSPAPTAEESFGGPTTRLTPEERDRALQAAQSELQDAQAAQIEAARAAEVNVKASASYDKAANHLSDAEEAKANLAGDATREQRFQAAEAVDRAAAQLANILSTGIDSDAELIKSRNRVLQIQGRIKQLSTHDLLDGLGDQPDQYASAGHWDFSGNSLRVKDLSAVSPDVEGRPSPSVFVPGLTDQSGRPLVWQRAAIYFPETVPDDYLITIRLLRLGGAPAGPDVMIPVRGGTLVCEFDSTRRYDPYVAPDMAQLVGQGSPILTAGIVHKVAIQLGNGRRFVVVAVDGRVRLRWPGEEAHKLDRPGLDEYPPPRFPTDLQSQMPPAGKIGLCVTGSRVEILSAELRPTTPSDSIEEPK